MAISPFGTTNTDPNAERLWFQNPVQTLNPEVIRPFSFSQVPSRLPIYEDDAGNLPQQTAGSAGITMDLSSKFSMSTNINEKYNFDVQQDNTAFVFNMNNTNNMVEVNYATQDLINNNNYITNNSGGGASTEPSFGASAVIVSYSNMVWSDFENEDSDTNFQLSFTVTTSTYANGLLISVVVDEQQEVVTLTALDTLYFWYLAGVTNGDYVHVRDVYIDGDLVEQYSTLNIDHGLVIDINDVPELGIISPLTDCDP